MSNPAEAAAEKLAWEMQSWTSIELRCHVHFESKVPLIDPGGSRSFDVAEHFIETSKGQRMYETRLTPDSGEPTEVTIDYTDGSKAAQLLRREGEGATGDQVSIRRIFAQEQSGQTHRPEPLKYLYVGLEPLSDALPRGQYLGEGRHLDRDCDRFLFTGVRHNRGTQDFIYWLDRATAIPLKVERFADEQSRIEERPFGVWNAESLDEVEGRHLVRNSEYIHFQYKGTDPHQVQDLYEIVTDSVSFDGNYPKATFWPKITDETFVIDSIRDKATFPKARTEEVATTAAPIRAIEPTGWAPSLATTTMLLGALCVAVGGMLWWRRR